MWGSLESAIIMVAEIVWLGYLVMLLAFVKFYPRERSGIIALAVWSATDLVSTAGSPSLYSAVANGSIEYGMWFVSFVILNTVAILVTLILHRHYDLLYSPVAIVVCKLLIVMSMFHMAMFIDRMLLDVLPEVYRYGLMSLKFLAFYLVFQAARSTQRRVA